MPVCGLCHLSKAEQYCPACIRDGLANHGRIANGYKTQSTTASQKAYDILHTGGERSIDAWRRLRAEVADSQQHCMALEDRIERIQRVLKESVTGAGPYVSSTRQHLSAAKRIDTDGREKSDLIIAQQEQVDLTRRMIRARRVLVEDAIRMYDIRSSSDGLWEIAGLLLPPPHDFRLYPREHINGVLLHIVDLVILLSQYLAVTLPYTPTFVGLQDVGDPIVRANPPFNSGVEYRDTFVLRMSSTALASTKKRHINSARNKHRAFLTAYALLAHSVAYLAWSQGVSGIGVPQREVIHDLDSNEEARKLPDPQVSIPVTNILQTLHALIESPLLGRKSHLPGVQQMRDLGFSLDVRQVVNWVLAADDARWGGGEQSEEWDLVEEQKV